jgi:hypothetical protein
LDNRIAISGEIPVFPLIKLDKGQLSAWQRGCGEILGKTPELKAISTALQSVQNAARKLEINVGIFANPLFRFAVKESLNEICNQLNDVVTGYSVPADRYPAYLAALQRKKSRDRSSKSSWY